MEIQNSKKGIIVNCLWAYVYEEPNIYSNVLCAIQMLRTINFIEDLEIDPAFYAVIIPGNRIGYCLKDYIVEISR